MHANVVRLAFRSPAELARAVGPLGTLMASLRRAPGLHEASTPDAAAASLLIARGLQPIGDLLAEPILMRIAMPLEPEAPVAVDAAGWASA